MAIEYPLVLNIETSFGMSPIAANSAVVEDVGQSRGRIVPRRHVGGPG